MVKREMRQCGGRFLYEGSETDSNKCKQVLTSSNASMTLVRALPRALVQDDLPCPCPSGEGPVPLTRLYCLSSMTNTSSLMRAHQNSHHNEAQSIPPS